MKQIKLTLVLTVLMSMVGLQAFAEFDRTEKVKFGIRNIYYYVDRENNLAEVTSLPSGQYTGNVVIPSSVNELNGATFKVVAIDNQAFRGCSGLTSVTIPNSVTSIGYRAFQNCSSLTSITIPKGVTSIGYCAFYLCSNLTSVIIPEGVTSIGSTTFSGCSSLTYVSIPNSVTSIGQNAFDYCSSLTSVTIPNSVTSIDSNAFAGCSGLTSVTIPDGVTSISYGTFAGCSSLTSVSIPNSVTSIGEKAFYNCSGLISVTIPNSVTSIGYRAFQNCSSLTSVTIPESVTSIDSYAFHGTKWFNDQPDGVVYLGSCVYGYKGTMPENTSITIKDGTKSICTTAFLGCTGLSSVSIPESVTSISHQAFAGCSSLTSVSIPNSVTSIGGQVFYGCSSLTSVTIPESVTSIGQNAFHGTKWFNDQPDGVVYLGSCVYGYKGTMPENTSITIKDGTKSICDVAFYGCSALTSITIPNSVTSIGNNAFYNCYNIKNIYCYAVDCPVIDSSTFASLEINIYNNSTLHVPAQSVDAYKSHEIWGQFKEIVPLTDEEMAVEQITLQQNVGAPVIYNLKGQRIAAPTKGLNIINGRKVVIR